MEKEIELIMDERKNVLDQISSIRSANIRIIVGGIASAFFVFTFVLTQKHYEVLIILPYFLLTIMFYNLLLFSGMYTLFGYLKHLDEKLNKTEEGKCIKWAEMADKHINYRKFNWAIIILILILFGLIFYKIWNYCFIGSYFSAPYIGEHFIICGFFLFILCELFRSVRKLDKSVYKDLSNKVEEEKSKN